jgi:hypothetical protein
MCVVNIPEGVVLKHSREPEGRRDTYFDIMKLKSPEPKPGAAGSEVTRRRLRKATGAETVGEDEEMEGKEDGGGEDVRGKEDIEEEGKISKFFQSAVGFLLKLLDVVNDWLEDRSALFREVVEAVQESRGTSPEGPPYVSTGDIAGEGGVSTADTAGGAVAGGVSTGDTAGGTGAVAGSTSPVAGGTGTVAGDDGGMGGITPAEDGDGRDRRGAGPTRPGKALPFDERAGILDAYIGPTPEEQQRTEAYEDELKREAGKYTRRFTRLGRALYYVFLSSNQYVPFFFIILSIIVNGNLLSLVYAVLLFGWGLLSVPWPSKRFWLTLIFYTMFVLVVKYAFQFHDIPALEDMDTTGGLYPPRLIGIERRDSFVSNAVVDILLLTFLLIHRGLLFVSDITTYDIFHALLSHISCPM